MNFSNIQIHIYDMSDAQDVNYSITKEIWQQNYENDV
jgi:hypothetical protein